MNKSSRKQKGKKDEMSIVPLSWRLLSWLGASGIAAGIFWAFYYSQAHNPNPNPYHPFDPGETALFGFIFGVGGAFMIKLLIIDMVLLRITQKRSTTEIIEEVVKDVAKTTVEVAAVGLIDAATGSSGSSSSSSPGGSEGGGGEFGGGGASGDF